MTIDKTLRQGIAAVNAGQKTEARRILMQVVRQDKRNEMAWLWLSGTVDTDEERRICLENVLAIDPNNGAARRGLEHLLASKDVRPLSAMSSSAPGVDYAVTLGKQPAQPPASAPDETVRKKSLVGVP
jgi:hypothetical protein